MLTGHASVPDLRGFDQRVLEQAAEAKGQRLIGGMVIDVEGAGLGCEGDIKAGVQRKVESCWTGIVLLGRHLKVQKPFVFCDRKQATIHQIILMLVRHQEGSINSNRN